MRVWAVSLSTDQLSPNSLTTCKEFSSIRSLIGYDNLRRREPFSALPLGSGGGRYT